MFCFYRDAHASVSCGDNSILKIVSLRINQRVNLRMDFIIQDIHVATYVLELRACIIGHFFLRNNASLYFMGKRCEWFDCIKKTVKTVSSHPDTKKGPLKGPFLYVKLINKSIKISRVIRIYITIFFSIIKPKAFFYKFPSF